MEYVQKTKGGVVALHTALAAFQNPPADGGTPSAPAWPFWRDLLGAVSTTWQAAQPATIKVRRRRRKRKKKKKKVKKKAEATAELETNSKTKAVLNKVMKE